MSSAAASVRARLLNLAKAQGVDFNQMLVRYALERLLYRLSRSLHAHRFLLKGALLFTLWYDLPHRATRDVDLLGFGSSDLTSLKQSFRDIAGVAAEDGLVFEPGSVVAEEIRKDARYDGARVHISASLARARCKTQIDVGFGDAVTPGPVHVRFPVLLADMPAPRLRTYPVQTVIAEKLHAITVLGMTNSRLKDYFDLAVLIDREALDCEGLARAVQATFERRGTALPSEVPIGLTDAFGLDRASQTRWQAFAKKNGFTPEPLITVVSRLRKALAPVLVTI